MKILMFAPAFAPMNNPEAIVNGKLALAFLKKGWTVDVITRNSITEYEYSQEIDEIWSPLKEFTYQIRVPQYKGIIRYFDLMKCFFRTGHPIPGCRWASYAIKKASSLLKHKKYDIIISRAMPDNAHLPAMLLSIKYGIPWIANWNDPHEEKTPVPWEKARDFSLIKKHYLNQITKHVTWHTFPSEKMRQYMSNYFPQAISLNSSVFPHIGLDYKVIDKQDPDYFRICYSGALYKGRDPSPLFKSIKELFLQSPEIKKYLRIVLIGKFNNQIIDLISSFNLKDFVVIEEPVSYLKSLQLISKMDILFLLESNYNHGIFLPSKMVDYCQVNRPILALGAPDSEVQYLIDRYGGGLYIPHSESARLKDKIFELFLLWEKGNLNVLTEKSNLSDVFDSYKLILKYEKLFEQLIEPIEDTANSFLKILVKNLFEYSLF
jgi:hypothetical protein